MIGEYDLTVAKLKEELSKLPDEAKVVILYSATQPDDQNRFLKIDSIMRPITGTSGRKPDGSFVLTFEPYRVGAAAPAWVVITASTA